MHPYRPLRIIETGSNGWEKKAIEAADSRRNFVVVIQKATHLRWLCHELGCDVGHPEKLGRWGIHALADVLEPQDYSTLLGKRQEFDVHLIEQLRLKRNAPPRIKPFILYCEVRGVISEHDTLEEAGTNLLDYLDSFRKARIFPLAGIYQYKNHRWDRVRAFSPPLTGE